MIVIVSRVVVEDFALFVVGLVGVKQETIVNYFFVLDPGFCVRMSRNNKRVFLSISTYIENSFLLKRL